MNAEQPASQPQEPTRSIVEEYDVPHAPERVWRALSEAELLSAWLMPNDLDAEVGQHFQFHSRPVPGWDGIVYCQVLAVEPERRLSYSWCGGSDEVKGYGHKLNTTVTWTLTPSAGGTHLRLDHDGFTAADSFAFDAMSKGWRGNVAAAMERVLAEI